MQSILHRRSKWNVKYKLVSNFYKIIHPSPQARGDPSSSDKQQTIALTTSVCARAHRTGAALRDMKTSTNNERSETVSLFLRRSRSRWKQVMSSTRLCDLERNSCSLVTFLLLFFLLFLFIIFFFVRFLCCHRLLSQLWFLGGTPLSVNGNFLKKENYKWSAKWR